MRRILFLIILSVFGTQVQAQHTFQNTSLSEALIELDKSSKRYSISFVYDELEDFTVTKTIRRGRSLPDAVREVCGFYPIRISTKGNEIFVECMQKDRTKLMGRLIGPDRQPVAYANITLFSPSDSTYLGGGVSNEAGDFVIPCSATQARVRISYVGFKTIEQQMPVSHVGTIRMQMENNYLGSVSVSGRMPIIRSESDRLQYIVSNDEFAKGHSALELLNRVPMVSMSGGRAMILGKGPSNFMLNGRVSEMGNEAIQQKLWTMRAEDIERIEVISIPSGRDIMEMGGGYINIVMHRDQTLGWRGDVSTQTGISDDLSGLAGGSFSYASEQFDMTIDAHGGYTTQTTDNLMTYKVQRIYDVFSDTHTKQTDKELAANLTFRYLPAKNLELGGMLSWQMLWPEKRIDGELTSPEAFCQSESELAPDNHTSTKNLTAYCDWHLDSKGKILSLTYNNYKKDDDAKSEVSCGNMHPELQFPVRWWSGYYCYVDYHIQSGRIDLMLPFNLASIDVGASYTSIRNQSNIVNLDQNAMNISSITTVPDYREKTKVAYLSIHRDWDRFAIKAGLRYEHIAQDRDIYSYKYSYSHNDIVSTTQNDSLFYGNYWLPSFSISFKPEEGHLINLSWGTSCLRPNFYHLNPIRIYKTGYEYTEGTPMLKPSRRSEVELSYHNHKGLFVSAYHHHANNVTEPFTMTGTDEEDYSSNILFYAHTKYLAMGRCNQTGLYLRYQHQITPHLLATAEGNVCYHDFLTDYYNESWGLYGWGKYLAVSADWFLNARHTLLLNARYQHWFSDYAGLTKTDNYGYFYFALRYSMLNDRLKLSLVAKDPFHQHVTDETNYGCRTFMVYKSEWTECSSHTNHHTHYIGLTATYSLGGKKVRQIQRDKKDTESERAIRKQ